MLILQKHILLLNDFYFGEFAGYLSNKNAELPLKLIKAIRSFGWEQPESDALCSIIYNSTDEKAKRKFLQLTHHTFKLSSFLSRNYPSYLKHNLMLIEELINKGENNKALLVAENLVDIAGKTEDFSTHANVLKFFAQRAFITDSKDSVKYHRQIEELHILEKQQNEIYAYIREYLHFKRKENLSITQLGRHLEFFNPYINSRFLSISILARFGRCYELSFLNHSNFYNESTFRELEAIERDLNNNGFLIFPFLDDVVFKVMGLKLQWMVNNMDSDGMLRESMRMIEESSQIRFWKSFLNLPELFAIAIQCSHYLSHYGETFREDFYAKLPEEIKQRVDFLKKKLKEDLDKPIWNEGYLIKLINTRSFYSGLLLLGTREEIQQSIDLIEETLISYQQIPFQKFLDGMFASLIIGYFSLKNYRKVTESYKRYRKSTAGNIVNEENDLTICAYYYSARWITSERKQYVEKLQATLETCRQKKNLHHVAKLIGALSAYFKIPLSL